METNSIELWLRLDIVWILVSILALGIVCVVGFCIANVGSDVEK